MTKLRFQTLAVGLVALLSFLGAPDEASAVSVKGSGMGGASLAYAQDSLTVVQNPAQAVELCNRADVGFTWRKTIKSLTISDRPLATLPSGTFKPRDESEYFPEAGINYWLLCDVAVGVAYTNYESIRTRYREPLTDLSGSLIVPGSGTRARFKWRVDTITGTIGYRINDCHSIGIGVNFYINHFAMDGLNNFAVFSSHPNHFTGRGRDDVYAIGTTFGWVGRMFDCFTFAASYSPRVTVPKYIHYEGFLSHQRIDLPQTGRLGVAWQAMPCLVVELDGEYRNYSKIRSLSNGFTSPTFGFHGGSGFGWRDQWAAKLGAEYQFDCNWSFRAGYRYERTPLHCGGTANGLNVFTLHTVQHYLSAGATLDLGMWGELSAFGEYGFERTCRGHWPTLVAPGIVLNSASLAFREKLYRAGIQYGTTF